MIFGKYLCKHVFACYNLLNKSWRCNHEHTTWKENKTAWGYPSQDT